MTLDEATIALVLANLAAYISLAAGLVQGRMWGRRPISGMDAKVTFRILESTMRERFGDLPEGFTWREGFARARQHLVPIGVRLRWDEIERSLEEYEAYRYGGGDANLVPPRPDPIVDLIRALRRVR